MSPRADLLLLEMFLLCVEWNLLGKDSNLPCEFRILILSGNRGWRIFFAIL
jgi:hypothetical protein